MFLFFLARNKLEKTPRNKPKVYFDAQLPTKELATIITSFLPIGFAPQRSFVTFLRFVVFCNDKQHYNDYQYRSHMFTPYLLIVL
jgi:hypothetical protein